MAVTRGRDDNQILVVTDTHNILDAIDTLQQILCNDRADTPATTVRRELAATVPPPPELHARCEIPDWFADTYRDAINELASARSAIERHERDDADVQRRLSELDDQLRQLEPACEPHDRAIADARAELDTARNDRRLAERDLANSGVFGRRTARRELTNASRHVDAAQAVLDDRISRAEPILSRRSELEHEYRQLRDHLHHGRWLLRSIDRLDERIDIAQHTITALNTWNRWASGQHVTIEQLVAAVGVLEATDRADHAHLAEPVHAWAQQNGLRLAATVEPPGIEIAVPTPDLW